jgi:excisionase family DNA binding protein
MQIIQINENEFRLLMNSIKSLEKKFMELSSKLDKDPVSKSSDYLTVKEAAKFLKKSVPTLRRMIASREIPFSRSGKKLIFFKVYDLIAYMESKKVKSISELENEAAEYFRHK